MIIYTDIVGDLFHSGHVNFLRLAKQMGSKLIVGITSDKDVSKYKRLPIIDENNRKIVIESCRYVDQVIENCPTPITKEFIDNYSIDIVVHGDDMNNINDIEKWYKIPNDLGILKFIKYTSGISTTEIIEKIKFKN